MTAVAERTYTKDQIRAKLETSEAWLEHGIVALYKRQTSTEQRVEEAIENNGVGFNKPDSNVMSYYARWLLSGRHLSGIHLERARKRILKYSEQLARIANKEI